MLSGSDGKLSHLRLVSWFIGGNTPLILGDSDVRFTRRRHGSVRIVMSALPTAEMDAPAGLFVQPAIFSKDQT